jgi:hypothetical protein
MARRLFLSIASGTLDDDDRYGTDEVSGRWPTMDGQKFRRRAEFLMACTSQMNDPEAKAGLERMGCLLDTDG